MTDLERAAKLCEEVGMPNGVKVTSEGKWALCQTAPTPEDINGIVLHPIHATAILCDHFERWLIGKGTHLIIDVFDGYAGVDVYDGRGDESLSYEQPNKLAALCAAVESEVK